MNLQLKPVQVYEIYLLTGMAKCLKIHEASDEWDEKLRDGYFDKQLWVSSHCNVMRDLKQFIQMDA